MLFTSQAFLLLFLPAVLLAYHLLARTVTQRLLLIVASSLFFYAWWNPRFLPLLLGAVSINWMLGRLISNSAHPRFLLACGVTINLAVLAVFKYADFLIGTWFHIVGGAAPHFDIVLPLAISFFTFQHIAYLVDSARGHTSRYSWLEFVSYVSFFPHLIAGPIVRHGELIPQFQASPRRPGTAEMAGRGCILFTLGLFKKVVLADEMAALADPVFGASLAGQIPELQTAWVAATAYSLQLYFDFSGYSDMALGLAGLFGLTLPINFDCPYQSTSLRDFWRRWHMTLSRFLRDYLYIPLGGNRVGQGRMLLIIMATMLLCGLWHGAGWTFVAWGGFHGAGICFQHLWGKIGWRMPKLLGWLLTMVFVIFGWVLFRAESFESARLVMTGMLGGGDAEVLVKDKFGILLLGGILAALGPSAQRYASAIARPSRTLAIVLGLTATLIIMRVGAGRSLDFIYFQF